MLRTPPLPGLVLTRPPRLPLLNALRRQRHAAYVQNGATALTLTVFKDHWPCTQILREAGAPDCPTNREAFQVLQQGYFNFNKSAPEVPT